MDLYGSKIRKILEGPAGDTFSHAPQVKVFLQFLREEEFEMCIRNPFYITYSVLYMIMLK